ncbi:MAG: hypothetical protein D6748_06000 [Calditrichaeota bacterium]|nr:MAG: hypothetical protein D6748_06000 [Calditrichota bacterium]
MTFIEFQQSLDSPHPPEEIREELKALWFDARGDWDTAHLIVQALNTPEAAWVHAYLHRKEGDLTNAAYWYRRAGKPQAGGEFPQEWEEIVKALLD